ncbi:MAG: hypothetical protein A2046_14455 [Bacteroidetes bacterium GWA2_30_7]|nr:MAG: hypothetical protein A2046_14455 [Bacteroidetes bacterium GWA2_30_7]
MKNLIRFDWALKRLLRNKANFVVLEGFLSELLKINIIISEIIDSESNSQTSDDKFNRVDIIAKTNNKEIIIVELQINSELDYFHRMLFGASKSLIEHIKLREKYKSLYKIYSVNIVYFELGQGKDYVYHGTTDFLGIHNGDKLELTQKQKQGLSIQKICEIFPEYYVLKVNEFNQVAKDNLDEWIYFLKNNEIPDNFRAKGLKEAKEVLDEDKMSKGDKNLYKEHLENLRYTDSMIWSSKIEGRLEGMFEGEKKGKIEGKIESKLEIAKNLINAGVELDIIIKSTGLSKNEIEKIK